MMRRRSPSLIRAARAAAVIVGVTLIAGAQATPGFELGSGARAEPAGPPAEAHGWVVLARPADEGATLVHLPPRRGATHGDSAGVARRARDFESFPAAIAASGRRLYVVSEGAEARRVQFIEAYPTPLDGIWHDRPAGRMTPLPPLPRGGELLGFAVAAGSPAAMLSVAADPPGKAAGEPGPTLRLLILRGADWEPVETPEGIEASEQLALFANADRIAIVQSGERTVTYTRDPRAGTWEKQTLALPSDAVPIGIFRGRLVALQTPPRPDQQPAQDHPNTRLLLAGGSSVATIAEFTLPQPAVPRGLGAVMMPDDSGRLILIWLAHTTEGDGYAHELREISLSTGRVLFDGPVHQIMPVSAEEFRLLAVIMIVVLVVSLFVVLRPGGEQRAIVLPQGVALATPGRRLLATVLDVVFCAAIVSTIFEVEIGKILTGAVLLSPGHEWVTIPAVLAVGAVYATVLEHFFAGTLGKLLLGCRVIRGHVVPQRKDIRLNWAESATRNVIKWLLPPVAALAILEPAARHRGDIAAGSVVVVRADEPEEAP